MTEPEVIGRRAERSEWLDHATRVGLVAYGVVFLLIAWLAVQLALGGRNEDASPEGALQELARQPFGRIMVWAVAAGLFLLVVCRLIEAAFGHREEHDDRSRLVARVLAVLKACIFAALGVSAARVASGAVASGGSGAKSRGTTAKLMDLPGGQVIVVVIGLAVIGYACFVAWQGWQEKFAEHLETEGKLGWSGAGYLIMGRIGYLAKGLALALVGGLLVYAGVTHQAEQSGGLDQALQKVLQQPFGPVLLIVMGAGIACYGLFSLVVARHLNR